jgi:hypothetical protein
LVHLDSFVVLHQILCGFHKPRRLIPFNAAVIMARVYFILLPIP